MLDTISAEALTRSLMLGTARQPVPVERAFGTAIKGDDPKAALKALALLGQHNRFRRSAPISAIAAEPLFADPRRPLSESVRPLLLSLLSNKKSGGDGLDVVALAVADAMARNNVKLHPFDLPRLEDFVKAYGEQLGPSALAWQERRTNRAGSGPQDYAFVETIDETNWLQGRPAQKSTFIASMRSLDPAKARELVENAFPGEQAPSRLALLKALTNKLSLADAPFLEGLAKDRAQSVREMADEMLDRIPGTARAIERLQECLSRIKVTRTGLLRRRVAVQIEFPATTRDETQRTFWANKTFGAISPDEFAKALGLSLDEIAAAAADDHILTMVLAVQAARARRFDILARLVRRDPKAWAAMSWTDITGLADPKAAQDLAAAIVQPDVWEEMPPDVSLVHLYQKIRAPLPEPSARSLLASKAWRSFLDFTRERQQPAAVDSLPTIAILIPPSLRAALRTDLATLAPDLTARALRVMSLLDHIEAA